MDSTQNIAAIWVRPSSSFTYPPLFNDTFLTPHERIAIQDTGKINETVTGYIYHIYDSSTHTSKGWLPFDTARAVFANFAISALIGDTIQSPWDSIISSVKTITTAYSTLKIYPNPTDEYSIMEVASNCQSNVNLSLYDMQGERLQTIFNGKLMSSTRKFVCQTSSLSSGIYFVTLQSACETESIKLIKF